MSRELSSACFVSDARFETSGGVYWDRRQNFPEGHWAEAIEVFDEVVVAARVKTVDDGDELGPRLPPEVKVSAFPYFIGLAGAARRALPLLVAARRAARSADICVLRGPGMLSMLVWMWLAIRRRPYAVEVLGDLEEVFANSDRPFASVARRLVPPVVRLICRRASAALYVSHALKEKCPPSSRAFATVVSDVRMPEALFRLPSADRVTEGRLVIVHVGNMEQTYKGHDTMIEAIALCRDRGVDVELHLIGEGRMRSSFEELARSRNVADRVFFEGGIPWGPSLLNRLDRSDLFIFPSVTEAIGKALIEAMARGLPVIASRVGGIPEVVDKEMLIPPSNPEALARRIAELAADRPKLAAWAERSFENARRYADERLSPLRRSFYLAVREAAERQLPPGAQS